MPLGVAPTLHIVGYLLPRQAVIQVHNVGMQASCGEHQVMFDHFYTVGAGLGAGHLLLWVGSGWFSYWEGNRAQWRHPPARSALTPCHVEVKKRCQHGAHTLVPSSLTGLWTASHLALPLFLLVSRWNMAVYRGGSPPQHSSLWAIISSLLGTYHLVQPCAA